MSTVSDRRNYMFTARQAIQSFFVISFFLIGLLISGCTSYSNNPDNIVHAFMKNGNVQGVFVAVIKDDSVLYQKSFGFADIESKKKMSAETCMELGSISKAFTAEAIYDLHQRKLLNLNDPITKYLPQAPKAWSEVTILHLLKHTSGIQNYLLDPRFKAAEYFGGIKDTAVENFINNLSTDTMLKMFYNLPFEFTPGTSWSYSNTGYIILGKIAEAVTGIDFFELVNQKVTTPLEMHNTSDNEEAAEKGCLSNGYFIKDGKLIRSKVLKTNYAFSAGAWSSTGNDMIEYIKAIHSRSLPSDKAGYNWRITDPNTELPFSYEGGRFFSTYHGLKVISHGGGTPGFTSSWFYIVEKNISIIILTNRQDYAAIDEVALDVLTLYESSLQYPKEENKHCDNYDDILLKIIEAIKTDTTLPTGLSAPLKVFMQTENGKGFWKWYFERGFPEKAYCVDFEPIGEYKAYRFRLPYSDQVQYRITLLVNSNNEVVQMRWW